MQLNEKDRSTITNALRVAAEVYRQDAKQCREAGQLRVANGFVAQVEDAERLADLIDEAEEAIVLPDYENA